MEKEPYFCHSGKLLTIQILMWIAISIFNKTFSSSVTYDSLAMLGMTRKSSFFSFLS